MPKAAACAALAACGLTEGAIAFAADNTADAGAAAAPQCTAKRPSALSFNRWQEDWSALANPCVPREPFDALKYIPPGSDPSTYLSLGADPRDRFELNSTPLFGLGGAQPDSYVIERAEVHADARIGQHVQAFFQLEDARPFDKDSVSPVDKNPLDVEQAFVAFIYGVGSGTFKVRVGRQEMAFDLQRFVSVRDGPNVRQAYDALWADYEIEKWRFIGYMTQRAVPRRHGVRRRVEPVSHVQRRTGRTREHGVGRSVGVLVALQPRQRALSRCDRHRASRCIRRAYAGKVTPFDWDAETMWQTGRVGKSTIGAWAFGLLGGYAFASIAGSPRVGLQVDGASGDRHPGDGRVETFNPLFPNSHYFTLAGYTGYSNLVHVKPSITFKVSPKVTLLTALGFQWRETTADAIYGQGMAVVPGTVGKGTRWTGMYAQVRADWIVNKNVALALEAVHFEVGDSIRALGAHNADYVGIEVASADWTGFNR